jgi:hypothetical protein
VEDEAEGVLHEGERGVGHFVGKLREVKRG